MVLLLPTTIGGAGAWSCWHGLTWLCEAGEPSSRTPSKGRAEEAVGKAGKGPEAAVMALRALLGSRWPCIISCLQLGVAGDVAQPGCTGWQQLSQQHAAACGWRRDGALGANATGCS